MSPMRKSYHSGFRVKLPRLQLSHGRLRRRPQVGFSLEKTLYIQGEADEAAAESREAEEKAQEVDFPFLNVNCPG